MIIVSEEDFKVAELITHLRQQNNTSGAMVSFVGLVRDMNHGEAVEKLNLEHYPGMTEKVLNEICKRAKERFDIADIVVVHRIGELLLNDQIVFVGVCAKHRQSAFMACEYVMDHLKSEAPFWKKEVRNAHSYWLEQNEKDRKALLSWRDKL